MLESISTTMTFDWGAIVTALAPTIIFLLTWRKQRKDSQAAASVQKTDATEIKQSVGAVHTLVNGQREELVRRVAKLEAENARLRKSAKKKKKTKK